MCVLKGGETLGKHSGKCVNLERANGINQALGDNVSAKTQFDKLAASQGIDLGLIIASR
jgi:hypothetical protein